MSALLIVVESVLALYAAVLVWAGCIWVSIRLARRAGTRQLARITRKGDPS